MYNLEGLRVPLLERVPQIGNHCVIHYKRELQLEFEEVLLSLFSLIYRRHGETNFLSSDKDILIVCRVIS